MKRARTHTIRSRLTLLVIACVIPAFLMSVALIWHSYQREHTRLVRDSMATARALTAAVDRELAGAQAALFALSTSPHLSSGDLRAFYHQSLEVLPNVIATSVVLVDATGQQQINTFRPFGDPLPANGSRQVQDVFRTGLPVTTDLFPGPVAGRRLVAVGVPVRRDNAIVYVLSTAILPERLTGILTGQRLPPGWIAVIFDSTGTTVARTHEMSRFLGTKGNPALVARMREAAEDAVEITSLEGIPVLAVFSRSAVSNWTVAIGMPVADLTSQLWHLLQWLVLGLVLLLLGSLALAQIIGGRIGRSIHDLRQPALALGRGEAVTVPPLYLKEANEVGFALVDAARMLKEARHKGLHDPLTGLANRALFDEIVDHELAVCVRSGTSLAVLYIDLDGFKAVNDTHGHAAGDALLCAVAARLGNGIRLSDLAARLGGDEFAVVLVDSGTTEATAVAGKLAGSLSTPYPIGSLQIGISASIGVAAYPASGASSEALLQSADDAMYCVKAGRNRRIAPGLASDIA